MTVDIEKLQAKLDAATPGEWKVIHNGLGDDVGVSPQHTHASPFDEPGRDCPDCRLVVAMKTALPELLAMSRELARVRAALPFCDGNGEAYYVRATVEQNARLKAKVQAVTEQDQRLDALEIITKAECEKARAERDDLRKQLLHKARIAKLEAALHKIEESICGPYGVACQCTVTARAALEQSK